MLGPWKSALKITSTQTKLLVTDPDSGDVLKARLPMNPRHPRALLTLMEGLALWRGQPLVVVIGAGDHYPPWSGSGLFGDELWPGESQLVRYELAVRERPVGRLRGMGDFRQLRLAPRGGHL